MAVAVSGLNLTIQPMDQELRSLVLCDLAPSLDGVCFPVERFCRTLRACTADGPSILMWNDMLIALVTHEKPPITEKLLLTYMCGVNFKSGH